MTSATDELRRLLDERGVEYGSGFGGDTLWTGRYGIEWRWDKQEGTLAMYSHTITPEQAIAATLGRGTCKPTEEDCCPICGEDLVKCNVGIGELGGAVELDPPIYHNYCPNCGAKAVER